jgi:pimeloyl-ACP methyl ester carboxylesterase
MNQVTSKDGTTIAFTRAGSGAPVVLVDGALCYRASGPNGPLAEVLSQRFTVFTYDRRGRGESSDTKPYAVEREIEDLEALIEKAGGAAHIYGISSGGALALEAATRLPAIKKLALYEVPFVVDDIRPPIPKDLAAQCSELVAADRRGDAVKVFLTKGAGIPAMLVGLMRVMPAWSRLKAVSHTLPYDLTILGDDTGSGAPLPRQRWASLTVPTLVIGGGKSPAWMRQAMQTLADVLPNARHRTLEGQTHIVKPKALAPVLAEFFAT